MVVPEQAGRYAGKLLSAPDEEEDVSLPLELSEPLLEDEVVAESEPEEDEEDALLRFFFFSALACTPGFERKV